jgi:hypothetical protein
MAAWVSQLYLAIQENLTVKVAWLACVPVSKPSLYSPRVPVHFPTVKLVRRRSVIRSVANSESYYHTCLPFLFCLHVMSAHDPLPVHVVCHFMPLHGGIFCK